MISWLKGKIIKNWHQSSKEGIVLNVNGVGYEVQLLPKQITTTDNSNERELWIHQITREDSINLYGFNDLSQRDLFRKIITVTGIGPQIGMTLLENFEVNELVKAIEYNDINSLSKSQGIGKRIANRLVVELKNNLQLFNDKQDSPIKNQDATEFNQFNSYIQEMKSILNSLGYLDNEINEAIELITTKENENNFLINSLSSEAKTELMDEHLKMILLKLSQKGT